MGVLQIGDVDGEAVGHFRRNVCITYPWVDLSLHLLFSALLFFLLFRLLGFFSSFHGPWHPYGGLSTLALWRHG